MLALTFTDEAYEWRQLCIEAILAQANGYLFVEVTLAETGVKLDAWLVGLDKDVEMGDTVRIVSNNDSGSTSPVPNGNGNKGYEYEESVRAECIHIY